MRSLCHKSTILLTTRHFLGCAVLCRLHCYVLPRVHNKNREGECLTRTPSAKITAYYRQSTHWSSKSFTLFNTYQQHSTPINRSLSSVKVLICSKIIVYSIIRSDFVQAVLAVRHSPSLFLLCTLGSAVLGIHGSRKLQSTELTAISTQSTDLLLVENRILVD